MLQTANEDGEEILHRNVLENMVEEYWKGYYDRGGGGGWREEEDAATGENELAMEEANEELVMEEAMGDAVVEGLGELGKGM